jgi:hypothetical protein
MLTSARRTFEAAESFEAAVNLSTSLVKEAASTEPVKKSPPSKRAIINNPSAIRTFKSVKKEKKQTHFAKAV